MSRWDAGPCALAIASGTASRMASTLVKSRTLLGGGQVLRCSNDGCLTRMRVNAEPTNVSRRLAGNPSSDATGAPGSIKDKESLGDGPRRGAQRSINASNQVRAADLASDASSCRGPAGPAE